MPPSNQASDEPPRAHAQDACPAVRREPPGIGRLLSARDISMHWNGTKWTQVYSPNG